ncbi:hypothetical protein BDK61_0645 [Haloarcula quadrata]|uniref:Uncharacterized protein n=1 Tax=Haloarcula quadrata TaxID=182779 RepID=A0A495R2T6_9EURY|nr:FxLYD domain-containing protein [Haloarcula quadrata]RKS81366.1 hypothetical protein BDK61_0645 [Haloarcula quadrata]
MELNRRRYLTTLGTTASAIALAGCSGDDGGDFEEGSGGDNGNNNDGNSGGDTTSGGSGGDGSSNDIELLSHEMVREDEGGPAESVKVEGEAENVSGGELSYAEVEVKFYEGDTLAESFLDNINGWSAGETWGFEVQYPGIGEDAAAITDYEIRAGTSL